MGKGKVKKSKEITAGELFPHLSQRKILLKLHLAWVNDLIELSQTATHRSFPRDGVKYLMEVYNLLSAYDLHDDYESFVGLRSSSYEILNKLHAHFISTEKEETVM